MAGESADNRYIFCVADHSYGNCPPRESDETKLSQSPGT
jgi:hypothetical protein